MAKDINAAIKRVEALPLEQRRYKYIISRAGLTPYEYRKVKGLRPDLISFSSSTTEDRQKENDEIVEMRGEGYTLQEIGDKLGLTKQAVYQRLLSLKVDTKGCKSQSNTQDGSHETGFRCHCGEKKKPQAAGWFSRLLRALFNIRD